MTKPSSPSKEEVRTRIDAEPDFIALKRFDNSLAKLCAAHPNGAPDRLIAAALAIEESQVEAEYQSAVEKLRDVLVDD